MHLFEKIFFEEDLHEPVPYVLITSDNARRYIDDIAEKLSAIKKEIIEEQDGKIIVMLEEGGFNYCLNGFKKNLVRRIIKELDESGEACT